MALQIERSAFLKAAPHERTSERRGYANGFRTKRLKSKLGELQLEIPRVRGLGKGDDGFYPNALERGVRSERALKLAVAEMYVQGVSTRKVAQITKQLCGLEITSSQVSRAAKLLDVEIGAWQNRPLGEFAYLTLIATGPVYGVMPVSLRPRFWVETDGIYWIESSYRTTPTLGVPQTSCLEDDPALPQDFVVSLCMTCCWSHEWDRAVQVVVVVPIAEPGHPILSAIS